MMFVHIDALADHAVRHRVVGALDLDVIVGLHLGAAPLAELVGPDGQRPQVRLLEFDEARASAANFKDRPMAQPSLLLPL